MSTAGSDLTPARGVDWRGDLAAVPRMVLSRAVLLPALLAALCTALFLVTKPIGSDSSVNLLFQLFVLPPSLLSAFIAMALAPRARYLAAAIAGLTAALAFAFAVVVTPISNAAAGTYSDADKISAIARSLIIGPLFDVVLGAIFGDGLAWILHRLVPRLRQAADVGQPADMPERVQNVFRGVSEADCLHQAEEDGRGARSHGYVLESQSFAREGTVYVLTVTYRRSGAAVAPTVSG